MERTMERQGRLMGRTAMALAVAGLFAACQSGPSEAELAAQAEIEMLRHELLTRDSLITDMSSGFAEIEHNIALLDERERLIQGNKDAELDMDQRQRILRDIQLMNGLVEESRERIAELNRQLDGRKSEVGTLRKRLKEFEAQLAERDGALASLQEALLAKDFHIEQLTAQLDDHEQELAKRAAVIDQQEHAMNKVYFTMATARELEERGVVQRRGGFIGMGKTAVLSAETNESAFQALDKRETERIPLGVKKATIVTEHPENSYAMVEEGDELAYLEIKDADAFWRSSKHLVVAVK